jgi:hypothetical protein
VLTYEVRENLPTLNSIEIPSLFILNQGELAQMESMKAAVLTAFGDAEKFEIQTVPYTNTEGESGVSQSLCNLD